MMNTTPKPFVFTAPTTRTLTEQITNQLREAIATNQLVPGQRLVERELAESMHTSRGPVRDALMTLENEGLVTRYSHRGTEVAKLTVQDAEEIWSLREALELLAVDHIFARGGLSKLHELEDVLQQIEKQIEEGFTDFESIDLDLKFHRTLCRLSGHTLVLEAFDNLNARLRLLLLYYRRLVPGIWKRQGVNWHREIVEALLQGDVELTRHVVRSHLAAAFETIVQAVDQAGG